MEFGIGEAKAALIAVRWMYVLVTRSKASLYRMYRIDVSLIYSGNMKNKFRNKITDFRVVTLCDLVDGHQFFIPTYWFHFQGRKDWYPVSNYTMSHPRR
jgi:hypothetical protein